MGLVKDALERIEELEVERDELLAALKPFAYLAKVMEEGEVLTFRGVYVTYDQVQAAARAFAKVGGSDESHRRD